MSVEKYYSKGDMIRTEFPTGRQLPVYLGSGKAGACFDGYGLMNPELRPGDGVFQNAVKYRNSCHYHRGNFEMDAWISLYHVAFRKLPEIDGKNYTQKLDLYNGKLTTEYTLKDRTNIKINTFFSLKHRDVLSIIYEFSGNSPQIELIPEKQVSGWYGNPYTPDVESTEDGFTVRTNTVKTHTGIKVISEKGEAVISGDETKTVTFSGDSGRHLILINTANEEKYAEFDVDSIDSWAEEAAKSWNDAYGDAYVDIPDEFVNKMTARSVYYLLASFADGDSSPSAPMGWAGYGWKDHFPQDISFIHPAMLRLGFTDLAKAIVDYYRKTLADMKKITARIYGGKGSMCAWEYPIHPGDDLMKSGCPNKYQYEIHNAAYPARMAYETAQQLNNPEWTENTAKPLIRAAAEFYESHLVKEQNGKWSLHVIPSMSQDEFAEKDSRNYLCALYSARYSFKIAAEMGMTEFKRYLDDGLSFDLLLDEDEKLYKTSEGMLKENWGKEKHPVQMNPMIFLPYGELNEYEKNSYTRRADICADTKTDNFIGWTLSAFWLCASHMDDAQGLYYELHRGDRDDFTDPDQLGFYEASGLYYHPYYVTTHGFWLQAVLDAFVCDYSGETKICPAVPKEWKGAEYHNLRTKDGKKHSGKVK